MEVKSGYKQTEVGVIPEDWEISLLDSVGKRGSGHTPNKKKPEYWDGKIKWISLKDSEYLDNVYLYDTIAKISQKGIDNSSAVLHPPGTVVLSRDAGVGKSSIMMDEMAVSQHFLVWQCGHRLNNLYLYYWLQSKKPEFERIAMGSTIKTIGLPYFKNLKLSLPKIKEQTAIATALSDVDNLISGLDRLIEKKRAIKQAAMQELLTGKRRLPGFDGEWEIKFLGDIGDCVIGLTYKPENVKESGLLVLRSSNIRDGEIKFEDNVFVDIKVQEKLILKKGDILICVRNGSRDLIGKCAIIDKKSEGMTFGAFMSIYRTSYYDFVFHQFQSYQMKKQIHEHLGATINQITNKSLKSFKIQFPKDNKEQTTIANVLSDMDTEISALEKRRDKTIQIKQGMMQELLTGRIRLV